MILGLKFQASSLELGIGEIIWFILFRLVLECILTLIFPVYVRYGMYWDMSLTIVIILASEVLNYSMLMKGTVSEKDNLFELSCTVNFQDHTFNLLNRSMDTFRLYKSIS